MRRASQRPFFSNLRTIRLYWGGCIHSNGLSLRLLRRCLRVTNFGESPKGEVRRITIPRTPVNSVGCPHGVAFLGKGHRFDYGGDVEMAAIDDFDEVLERFKRAGNEFMKGNPKPVQDFCSHRDDVTLANPFGPPARGWNEVAKTQERGASYYRDGEIYDFEIVGKYVTAELACILWIERTNAKVGGAEEITPCDLRVTMTLRPEDGTWKVVHRHADPITTPRPAESVIQE